MEKEGTREEIGEEVEEPIVLEIVESRQTNKISEKERLMILYDKLKELRINSLSDLEKMIERAE